MAPNLHSGKSIRYSHRKHQEHRTFGELKSAQEWLKERQKIDNAEGLWRIHDDLYDVTDWLHMHPGGAEWLQQTKGTDITEAFEAHHLNSTAERMLKKFHIRHVDTPRNATFTFKEDGFYRTLKRRVAEEYKKVPKDYAERSKWTIDGLLFFTFFFSILSVNTQSWFAILAAALSLAWTSNAAHNFFHQRDNWRMYYFNISLLTVRDWRVSHVLSHHIQPNTLLDFEVTSFEPYIRWLPYDKKFPYVGLLATPIVYMLVYVGQFAASVIYMKKSGRFFLQTMIPLILPTAMYIFGQGDLCTTVSTWFSIIFVSSFLFAFIGVNAAHHHPKIFHDGDMLREDRDWGKFQLDAVMDRHVVTGSRFLVLTHFGDHALHHLFPTIDHSLLPFLYPVVNEVCDQFGMQLRFISIIDMIIGQFKQLINTTPNPEPPSCKTY